ncbi:hypothetical protein CPC08DRAFT_703075 [Agrocybe pediades]|nr:hypothetical protein CPC08DRAFT_703075 [Agrocybe pediades]
MDCDSDGSGFYWEEEDTLLTDLLDGPLGRDKDQYLDALADSLQEPFHDQGHLLKKEIAETLVPTHNHVKNIFSTLEKSVDPVFGHGISKFNEGCKRMETTMLAQYNDLNDLHKAIQNKITKSLEELKVEYARRDELWINLKASIDAIVNPTLESISDSPAKLEQAIAKLDKQAKSLESRSKDRSSVKKGLQDLFKAS